MPDRLIVHVQDYVALVHACRSTGPLRIDTHHNGARAATLHCHRLEPQAQITAGDPPMCFELRRHPLDRLQTE